MDSKQERTDEYVAIANFLNVEVSIGRKQREEYIIITGKTVDTDIDICIPREEGPIAALIKILTKELLIVASKNG